jgi:IclR family KDG regulon transcriptional repressor
MESDLNNNMAVKLRDIDNYINAPKLLPDDKRKPTVYKSVYRTANILKCLSNGINSVTEIANICNLDKSTVYRLLKTLNESGLTLQDPISRLYYVGPLITEIASNPHVTHEHLIWCAINEMKRLADLTGESIALSVLIGLQAVLLYEIRSIYDFALSAKKKVIGYIYAGASGKVLLSQLSNKDLKIAINLLDIKPLTEHTITDKEQLLAQLKQIARQGFAISYGEINPGALNISVPVKNYLVPATLGMLGPETRVQPKRKEFTDELKISGNRISENLKLMYKTG